MRKVLSVRKPYIENIGTQTRLVYTVRDETGTETALWYEVASEYAEYLCPERSDGIVVNLLLYAMERKYDIECEAAMSEQLYYQLTEQLIPSIARNIKKYHTIQISAPLDSNPLPSAKAVGASISGGVDSFYTVLRHVNRKESTFNVTHLAFFNAGASGAEGGDVARQTYKERIEWIRDVADQLGKKMVCVDTNLNEFLRQEHESSHTFRTLAIPLVLQKLFCKYYFASGLGYENFSFSVADTAHYDLLNTRCLSTENLTFYSSGGEATRTDKIKFISDFPITYPKLNVCIAEAVNCNRCDKCRRTMLALYAIGRLDRYSEAFDVEYFKKHKHAYFAKMMAFQSWKGNIVRCDWQDSYDLIKKEVTIFDRIAGFFIRCYRIVRRKVYATDFGKKLWRSYIAAKKKRAR